MGIEMEERKLKEIEHSKKRREVLQGFERLADTHTAEQKIKRNLTIIFLT